MWQEPLLDLLRNTVLRPVGIHLIIKNFDIAVLLATHKILELNTSWSIEYNPAGNHLTLTTAH